MKITYTERNGRLYAYRCTSKRVPGVRNPVSHREYLGVVDPDTGELIPKKAKGGVDSEAKLSTVRECGNVLMAKAVMDRLNMPERLGEVFGDRAPGLTAIVLAESVRPSRLDGISDTLSHTNACELSGCGVPRATSGMISSVLRSITLEDIRGFIASSIEHDPVRYVYVTAARAIGSGLVDNDDRSVSPIYKTGNVNLVFGLGGSGRLVSYGRLYGFRPDFSDRESYRRTLDGMTVVFARSSESPETVAYLSSLGLDFAVMCDPLSDIVRKESVMRPVDGSKAGPDSYSVERRELGIGRSGRGWKYIPEDDPDYPGCTQRVGMYLILDPDIRSRDLKAFRNSLRFYVSNGRALFESDPYTTLEDKAGWLSRYLAVVTDEDGHPAVRLRKGRMAEFRRTADLVGVITNLDDWDETERMLVYISSVRYALDDFFNHMGGYVTDSEDFGKVGGLRFVHYLAVAVRAEIRRTIMEAGMDISVDDALYRASALKVMTSETGDTSFSPVDRRTAEVLDLFGIGHPRFSPYSSNIRLFYMDG